MIIDNDSYIIMDFDVNWGFIKYFIQTKSSNQMHASMKCTDYFLIEGSRDQVK